MNNTFKIRMLRTLIFGHNVRPNAFYKGRTYTRAMHATNQPDWKLMGKVWVKKSRGSAAPVLLVAGDYEVVS